MRLPAEAGKGQWIDIRSIEGPVGFLMSIINAAKDWQDMLQSALPGYRERIVHVHLKGSEGGLNLNMSQETIDLLVELGDRAGTLLSGDKTDKNDMAPFKMDDHRWRRFLVAFARLEETLCSAARRWNRASPQESFADFRPENDPQPTVLRRFRR